MYMVIHTNFLALFIHVRILCQDIFRILLETLVHYQYTAGYLVKDDLIEVEEHPCIPLGTPNEPKTVP